MLVVLGSIHLFFNQIVLTDQLNKGLDPPPPLFLGFPTDLNKNLLIKESTKKLDLSSLISFIVSKSLKTILVLIIHNKLFKKMKK